MNPVVKQCQDRRSEAGPPPRPGQMNGTLVVPPSRRHFLQPGPMARRHRTGQGAAAPRARGDAERVRTPIGGLERVTNDSRWMNEPPSLLEHIRESSLAVRPPVANRTWQRAGQPSARQWRERSVNISRLVGRPGGIADIRRAREGATQERKPPTRLRRNHLGGGGRAGMLRS